MSWLFHSIARVFLISCVFKNAFADSDLFSDFSLLDYQDTQLGDNLFFSADPPEIYEETVSSEDLFGNDGISADHQEVALTEDLFNVQISSSCSEVRQFGRVRTRDAMCPPVPELPLDGDDGDDDDLSDFMTPRRTGPEPTDVDENGVGVMRDPDYYCHKYAAPGYKLAVCGSGILIDIDHYVGPFYSQIRFSRLITPVSHNWSCDEANFYCCMMWFITNLDAGLGVGNWCERIKLGKWHGYDTEHMDHIKPNPEWWRLWYPFQD